MAGFKVELFKGIRPRISAHKLPEGESVRAENARLGSGSLRPLNGKTTDATNVSAGDTATIYRFDNGGTPRWFEWTSLVDVTRGPIKDDALERTYYTGDGVPKYTYTTIADGGGGGPYPEDFRNLGIPAPTTAPTVSVDQLPEDNDDEDNFAATLTTNLLKIGTVKYTNYLSQVGASGEWSYNGTNGTILFDFPAGTLLRVLAVTDADNVTVESASGAGFVAESNSAAAYTKSMNEDGSGEDADWSEWRIPNGFKLNIVSHNLRVGDVIRVTRLGHTAGIRFTPNPATRIYYEQTWDTPQELNIDGSTDYYVFNANVGADAGATVDFTLQDSFWYEIDRTLSTKSESEERYYVYTFVSSLGEEGPPSPVSTVLECLDGDSVSISGLETPPSAGYDITDIRIYRTNSTADGAEYQLVKEISVAGSTSDAVENVDLGEVIPSTSWDPPDSNMLGITTMPNGMMVGFYLKTLFFCEPYFPHAWPAEYDQAVDFNIVGLANVGNSVVVLTEGTPYILSGSHPRNVNVRPYKFNQACLSRPSIATTEDSVYYASNDGLVELGINGGRVVTEPFCTKEEWAGFLPATMKGQIHDNRYIGFYDSANSIPQGAASLVTSGTITSSTQPSDIVAGGKTIILTLTNDFWVEAANNEFDNVRQDIIDNIVSAESGTFEWNAIRNQIPPSSVVRTSDSVVTITLPALSTYALTGVIESIRATAPGISLKVNRDAGLSSTNTFTIEDLAAYTSEFLIVGERDSSFERPVYAYIAGDPTDEFLGDVEVVGEGTTTHNNDACVYDPDNALYFSAFNNNTNVGHVAYIAQASIGANNIWTEGGQAATGNNSRALSMYYDQIDNQTIMGLETGRVEYSTDAGVTFTDVSNFPSTAEDVLYVLYGGSYVYTVGETAFAARSPDLTATTIDNASWSSFTMTWSGSSTSQAGAVSGNGNIIVIGNASGAIELNYWAHGAAAASQDNGASHGQTFTPVGLAFGGGRFVAISADFKTSTVLAGSETDGDNWSTPSATIVSGITIRGIDYDQGSDGSNGVGFIAFGEVTATGRGTVYTSKDGSTWFQRWTDSRDSSGYYGCAPRYPESSLD